MLYCDILLKEASCFMLKDAIFRFLKRDFRELMLDFGMLKRDLTETDTAASGYSDVSIGQRSRKCESMQP